MKPKKKRLFGTYCSIDFFNSIQNGKLVKELNMLPHHNALASIAGYNPIFAIPFGDIQQFAVWSALAMPQHPQILILFEATEYDDINYMAWLNFLFHSNNLKDIIKVKTTSKLREFIVPHISQTSIVTTVRVTNSPYPESGVIFLQRLLGTLTHEITEALEYTPYRQTRRLNVTNLQNFLYDNQDILATLQQLQTNPIHLKEKDIGVLIKKLNSKVFKLV